MSYYRSNNESNDYSEFDGNRQMDSYSNEGDTQQDVNLYQKYQNNRRSVSFNPQQQQQQNSANVRNDGIPAISQEDFRLLRECNNESFYYRCLPLSGGACAFIYYLARQRNMKPSIWHYMSAVFGGWFFGKLSYRRICEDRLVRSKSDSPFVKAIRRRRGLFTEDLPLGNKATFEGMLESDWETESKDTSYSYGAHEFAEDKDLPQQPKYGSEDSKPQFSTTYDDLRARNRAGLKM